jgi:hypothetical protein
VKSVPFGTVAQIPGARSPGRLKFVRWRLTFEGHKYVSLLAPTNFEVQACHAVRFKTKMEHVNKFQYNYLTSIFKTIRSPVRQLLAHTDHSYAHWRLFALLYGRENRLLRSLRPSVRQYQRDSHWTDFCKNTILSTVIPRLTSDPDNEFFG